MWDRPLYLDVRVRLSIHSRRANQPASGSMAERDGAYLQIGEVAERTGVTQRTLRFYEEKGLLRPPSRMEGGFRLYSEEDVQRVEQIRRMQSLLGMSLAAIKEMVEAEEVKNQIRAEYSPDADTEHKHRQLLELIRVTDHQREIIRQKISQLQAMQDELDARMHTFEGWRVTLESRLAERTQAL